ncbi:NAD(P)/FAD-dependent oxidoreductase [Confluentibacter lentus]|uniref:NAD(P)/FAD-dependent oxidoreductase n=1 Tax=Confluentibacter lentus TaxID=1699412 RepID=UPI000C2914C7|nr:NAD(P)/FAD-dependent oxidoreductase [Confluentibacter lentus]
MKEIKEFDVIIIGGSYAGLSAAMSLGRSLRNVLIIDSGNPCNKQTPHSHNFLTQDGKTPLEIMTVAKQQVEQYKTVHFLNDMAISGGKKDGGFEIVTASGKSFIAKKLIFATGIKDIMPNIKGFSECWGISVIHCPYCHGYEFRNQKTAIMANGEKANHLAQLVNNLTKDITILTRGEADFTSEQMEKLKKHNIKIVTTEISEIVHENGNLKRIVFKDQKTEPFDAMYAGIPFEQHSDIPKHLGCEITEQGYIRVDDFYKTTIEGVFACGDSTNRFRSVSFAVNSGNVTGAMVNMELTAQSFNN